MMDANCESPKYSKKCKKKLKKKRKKHSSTSSESSSNSDDTTSSEEAKRKRKSKKLKKKMKEKLKKHKKKHSAKEENDDESAECFIGPVIPNNLLDQSKRMAPETKDEWEKRQNVIKKVYDEQSGRYRLVKGDGEILEEIVSKDRHKEINKQATLGDGQYFQSKLQKP